MTSEVGKTIYEQLGGRAFSVVTGAHNYVTTPDGLFFQLPGKGGYTKQGINKVVITLLPNDTYKMQFYRVRKQGGTLTAKLLLEYEDVYFDQLVEVFEKATGLVGRMPKVRFA